MGYNSFPVIRGTFISVVQLQMMELFNDINSDDVHSQVLKSTQIKKHVDCCYNQIEEEKLDLSLD